MFPYITYKPQKAGERDRLYRVTIEDIKKRLQNKSMRVAVGNELVRIFKKNIKQGGRPEKFKPLAESTLNARRRRGNFSKKPLIDTGKLVDSIRAGVVGSRLEIKMVRYGEFANRTRPFIVVPPEERENLKKVFKRALKSRQK